MTNFLRYKTGLQNAVLLCGKVLINVRNGRGTLRDSNLGKRFFSDDGKKHIIHSPLGEIKIPSILFHESVFNNWSLWEKKTAIVCARSGKKYTFRELRDYSKAMAAGLQNKLNLGKGDMVAVVLPNCAEFPIVFLAASHIGITLTPINPNNTNFELQTHFEATQPKVTITCTSLYSKCHLVAEASKVPTPVIVLKWERTDEIPAGTIDMLDLFDHAQTGELKPVDVSPDDTLILPFSSGTTGPPKGVILTHRNLVSNLTQLSHPDTTLLPLPTMLNRTTVLGVLPMCHIYGMVVVTFFTLREGSLLVVYPGFSPQDFRDIMVTHKINFVFAVPPMITYIANPDFGKKHLKHLQFIVNGSARYNIRDAHKIFEKAEHVKIAQGYGMTEASPVITHTPPHRMENLPSIGIPIASTSLKVVDINTGETLPAGKTGELCVKGPQVMQGYYNRPKETKESFDAEGWLKTGDVSYYDTEGHFYVIDRLKELIKVSGLQVSPAELEDTLKILPTVKEVVVVGIPDQEHGEVPRAFIVPTEKGALTAAEVNAFLKEKLSPHKQLRGGIEFVDELPKSNTGKILRGLMKKRT